MARAKPQPDNPPVEAPPIAPEAIDRYAAGFDTPERREALRAAKVKLDDLNATMRKLQADRNAVFEGLEAVGLNKRAARYALAVMDSGVVAQTGYMDTAQLCFEVFEAVPKPGAESDSSDQTTH